MGHVTYPDGYVGDPDKLRTLCGEVAYKPWLVRIFKDLHATILISFFFMWDEETDEDKAYVYTDEQLLGFLGWKQEELEHAIQILVDRGFMWVKTGENGERLYWTHGDRIDDGIRQRLIEEKNSRTGEHASG